MKTTVILYFFLLNLLLADAPYYDVIGSLSLDEVDRTSLAFGPARTTKLNVPTQSASSIAGFNVGFGIIASVSEHSIILDSISITSCSYSLFHIDSSGNKTPVVMSNGQPITNIATTSFLDESSSGPTAFTIADDLFDRRAPRVANSVNGLPIGTAVNNVGGFLVTKQSFTWNTSPNFLSPTKDNGYVVTWNVRFVPTYLGVTYPEVSISTDFIYKVTDVEFPKLVSIKKLSDVYNMTPDEDGLLLTMKGKGLEFFKLQRSPDLVHWEDWGDIGEGDDWVGFDDPGDGPLGGYWSTSYRWTLFDRNFPDERRIPQREFYRMVWTGKPFVYKMWVPDRTP